MRVSPKRWSALAALALLLVVSLLAGVRSANAGPSGEVTHSVTAVAPPRLTVAIAEVTPSADLQPGDRFRVTVTLTNPGAETLRVVRVTLNVDASGLDLRGNETERVGTIPPGQSRQERWNVLAVQPGNYAMSASATGTIDRGGLTVNADSPAVLVNVGAPPTPALEVTIVGTEPAGAQLAGQRFRVVVDVRNVGGVPLRQVRATLGVQAPGLDIRGDDAERVGALAPGVSRRERWNVNALQAGTWQVSATAVGTPADGRPAVTATAAVLAVKVVQPPVALEVAIVGVEPASPRAGSRFTVTVQIRNTGGVQLREVLASIDVQSPGLDVRGDQQTRTGALGPGKTRRETWNVNAVQAGVWQITATATGTPADGQPAIDAAAPLSTVTVLPRP